MIDIEKLATFLRSAETLNFSETAKYLHLSQPAVSHQIKMLEKSLGTALFIRTNTGLQLSEAGRVLVPWTRRLLHDSNELKAMVASVQEEVVGELRISCSTTAGKYVLPQMAARFSQRFPGVTVRILPCMPNDVTINLLESETHIGVVSREILDPSFESQKFLQDKIILIVPSNHPWASRKVIDPSELLDEQLLIREETSGTRRVVLSELAKYDISLSDLNVLMELGNAEAIANTVAAGYGIAFVSILATASKLQCSEVVSVRVEGLDLRRTIYMVRKADSSPHRPRDAFWSFIHDLENLDLLHLPEQVRED